MTKGKETRLNLHSQSESVLWLEIVIRVSIISLTEQLFQHPS